ncbi:Tex family protein [Pontibacter sp. G13]|uniref:Tex family protein n=1 Tax=Pontibacter sp. G13 TaxID=3074898 RepID=UPI00288C1062|nr:Tex family protein [Pontibacter sp. G13]WNJ21094.1 Tex family protein [Pontibacter sp. G13]
MAHSHQTTIATELGLSPRQVAATLDLINEGATIPFMARYRKEVTGSLDEVQLAQIRDRAEALAQLDKRREAILKSLEERELLSDELKASIDGAESLTKLEDLYLPYKPKRRTKATIAREKGLEPLAKDIMEQMKSGSPDDLANAFIDAEKGVEDVAAALQGARDIIAEWVNEDADARADMRKLFVKKGTISTKVMRGKEEDGAKYKDYFEWNESVDKVPSHRLLAMRRGEKELILSLSIRPDDEDAVEQLDRRFVKGNSPISEQVREAVQDSYKRLMAPSMETEVRIVSKDKADEEAIKVFADNLRQLLLAAPLGEKSVLALDPGFRTGCKLVCLDKQGRLLEHTAIFPNPPQKRTYESGETLKALVQRHGIEVIAIGNGTASRETESFVKELKIPGISVVMVNESGASIYSASEVAREEFPNEDVTVRGAVSIGRRLMDPLAELVKLDPKSIGVGQYQHDVDQTLLKKSLDDTVVSCVNAVGVEVNTASKQLLTYVSGLGPSLAKNIVAYRDENGPFATRKELMKVPRLGAKAFEQCAGFLRIRDAKNPLDASAVHPESYKIVEAMAKDLGVAVADLISKDDLRKQINLNQYVTDTVGLPTLKDILEELAKPGRDPREKFEMFSFAEGVNEMSDLREGMVLPGIVTNITDFGAFVDIGVHQDGLVHLSQLANRFVQHPSEVVKVHQPVSVKVVSVDMARKRIGLSMKTEESGPRPKSQKRRRNQDNRRNSGPSKLEENEFFRVKPKQRKNR